MNEVQVKSSNVPSTHMAPPVPVLRSDIVVPYIVIAQGQSESVKQRKAAMGDIIRSTSFEKLGDPDKAFDVIYLHYPKANWVIEKKPKGANRFEWVKTIPRDAANETLPWTYFADEDGNECDETAKGAIEYRRQKQLLVFALLPGDIEAAKKEMAKVDQGELPDPSKALTPVLISFRSTGYKSGKDICTFYTQAASMRVPMWKYQMPLTCTLEQNDDGSFYVWNVDRTKAKAVSKENLPFVEQWAAMLETSAASLQVHDEAEGEGYQAPQSAVSVNQANKADVC